ncbi:MAG TPA: universal stress protein [Dictyobacter sp.]|nr:universal stress protein [Dictyobacter sp.]
MFKRILVPLDGSERAEAVLPTVAVLARAYGSIVTLVRVVPEHVTSGYHVSLPESEDDFAGPVQDGSLKEASGYLERVASSEVMQGLSVAVKILVGANVAEQILALIPGIVADLVVVCSHGHTGLKRWSFGSVAHKLVRHSSVPVLVLREDQGSVIPHFDGQHSLRVLVGLDGSTLAEAVVEPALQISSVLSAPAPAMLQIVEVLPLPTSKGFRLNESDENFQETRERIIKTEEAYLDQAVQKAQSGYQVSPQPLVASSLVLQDDVASTLIEIAEHGTYVENVPGFTGCDLIALSTHGRSGLQRWALGSVTEHILEATTLPLLVVHPDADVNISAQA